MSPLNEKKIFQFLFTSSKKRWQLVNLLTWLDGFSPEKGYFLVRPASVADPNDFCSNPDPT